ncbi:MAG: NTP transferase domain-containing protein [Armatimonadota bacterium]
MSNASPRIGAVVLAGGNVPAPLAHLCTHRALLNIRGRNILEYLLEALHGVSAILATAVVAPEGALAELDHLEAIKVPSGETLVENMQRGSQALAEHQVTHFLFITGDVPLVTAEGIQSYLEDSISSGAALTYPIIPKLASEKRFPSAKRTYVRIREGIFTGGNAIFTTARTLDHKHALIQSLYAARKEPLKLARLLGWSTILRLVTGTLTLPYLEAVAQRILGAPVRAIVTKYAEIGFDVDKAEDLAAVEKAVAKENWA